jgi:hypothetical protein
VYENVRWCKLNFVFDKTCGYVKLRDFWCKSAWELYFGSADATLMCQQGVKRKGIQVAFQGQLTTRRTALEYSPKGQ